MIWFSSHLMGFRVSNSRPGLPHCLGGVNFTFSCGQRDCCSCSTCDPVANSAANCLPTLVASKYCRNQVFFRFQCKKRKKSGHTFHGGHRKIFYVNLSVVWQPNNSNEGGYNGGYKTLGGGWDVSAPPPPEVNSALSISCLWVQQYCLTVSREV